MNTPTSFGEYLANLQPTPEQRAGIIAEFSVAFSALVKVYNLTDGKLGANLGASNWFCEGYPFGQDLGEFIAEFGNYLGNLKGTN